MLLLIRVGEQSLGAYVVHADFAFSSALLSECLKTLLPEQMKIVESCTHSPLPHELQAYMLGLCTHFKGYMIQTTPQSEEIFKPEVSLPVTKFPKF